jgi:hypothetical protein
VSTVSDVGDAVELTFNTRPHAAVTVTLINPDQDETVTEVVPENPAGSGIYPYTFIVATAGIWTAQFVAAGNTAAIERYYVRATPLTGPPPLAVIGDVSAQHGTMSLAEESLAGWLLRNASNMLRGQRPLIDQQLRDGKLSRDLVALAVTNMVLRVLRNPNGLRSESVGPFSRSWDTTTAAGLLVVTDDDLALIQPTDGTKSGTTVGQFRPRASLAIAPIQRRGGWPDGWW